MMELLLITKYSCSVLDFPTRSSSGDLVAAFVSLPASLSS